MRKIVFLFLMCVITGCTYAGEKTLGDYLNDPKSWVKDPHFGNYQEKRDAIESQYLRKEISYAQYLEERTALDDQYSKEVVERNQKIMDDGK